MRVLVACEFSGTVRRAFRALGHDAWSCDLLPAEDGDLHHIQADVLAVLDMIGSGYWPQHGLTVPTQWNLMIAHPPCTHLAVSGARWFKEKVGEQAKALEFVRALMNASIPRICIENPVSVISSRIRKPDQIIQPWMFGHAETKTTCLWLKGLPKLTPTHDLRAETMARPECERMRLHYLPPSTDRWKERSRTFPGIASAMAAQWSNIDDAALLAAYVPPLAR